MLRISPNTSVSLDLLRGGAALTVFLHHCNLLGLDGGVLSWFRRDVGHSAVVIFFVLSGTVIAATTRPNGTALDYGIRRASRIWSVAIPAILLIWLLDLSVDQPGGATYQLAKPWIYLPLALAFAGDLWSLAEPAFSDVPWWSLNYEVWYYVAFGTAVFARGMVRLAATLAVVIVMGPKLALLFPLWLGGGRGLFPVALMAAAQGVGSGGGGCLLRAVSDAENAARRGPDQRGGAAYDGRGGQ